MTLVAGVAGCLFFEELVDRFVDLLVGEPKLEGAMDCWSNEEAELLAAVAEGAIGGRFEDAHALAAHALDDPFDFEAGVGLADGHGIDLGGAGDFANAGKHVAWGEAASRDEGTDLIDELPINRNP